MLWTALAALVLVYAGLCLALFLFQSRLVFLPARAVLRTPSSAGLDYEDVRVETEDGVRLHGWYVPAAPSGTRALLFLHGNAGNVGDRIESIALFHHLGLSTLIVDYRGYGHSAGSPCEQGTYDDARAAWRHLVRDRGFSRHEIVVFGRSLGAGVAVALATEVQCAGLAIESAFISVPDLGAGLYPLFPVRMLARIHYDSLRRLPHVCCPVLVAHSREDEIVPFDHARRLYDAAPDPKRFLEMRGGHNDGFLATGDAYLHAWREWLDEIASGER